jgi:hypothetical protein
MTEDQSGDQQEARETMSFADLFHQLLQGQFGDYVTGERFDDIISRLFEEAMAQYIHACMYM